MYYENENNEKSVPFHPAPEPEAPAPLHTEALRALFTGCDDLTEGELLLGGENRLQARFFFLDGLIDGAEAAETVLRPATELLRFGGVTDSAAALRRIMGGLVFGVSPKRCDSLDDGAAALLEGSILLVFDELGAGAAFQLPGGLRRNVEPPQSEQALKGARDAFTETLRANTALLRRHLKTPALRLEKHTLGRKSQTAAEIVYVDRLCDPALPKKLAARLDALDVDGVLCAAALEAAISDAPRAPLPQFLLTERPDRFCLNLLEGRVGLLVDGLPLGWLVPGTLSQQLRVPDDLSEHSFVASALTVLRHLGLLLTLLLPALYAAIAMYHQEMIPTKMLLSVIESKQAVPFSTAAEVLGMLVSFELLQEAGLRLPGTLGQSVSIIGALIVGQSAVEARVISPIAVIVVATAGIAGYTVPNQDLGQALRLMRFALVLCAVALGIFGVAAGSIALLWLLCSLDSYGVAYLAPSADGGLRDALRGLIQKAPDRDVLRDARLKPQDQRRRR